MVETVLKGYMVSGYAKPETEVNAWGSMIVDCRVEVRGRYVARDLGEAQILVAQDLKLGAEVVEGGRTNLTVPGRIGDLIVDPLIGKIV